MSNSFPSQLRRNVGAKNSPNKTGSSESGTNLFDTQVVGVEYSTAINVSKDIANLDADSSLNIQMQGKTDRFATVVNDPAPEHDKLDIIYDSENKIKAATFTKIIEALTHPNNYDSNFMSDFLLTYRSFASSREVVDALISRYENPKTDDVKLLNSIWIKILNVLKHWIEKCWWDFSKDCPALSDYCNEFLTRCRSNPAISKVAENIQDRLMRKIVGSTHTYTVSTTLPPTPHWTTKELNIPLLRVNSEELARQLTMIEWNIWSQIQPWECLGLSWTKKNKEEMAPNVLSLINRFNSVSGWVAASILSKETPKKRSKFITKFIEISSLLNSMNNFNGVMEIVAGLNRGPVYRLKQSWDLIATPIKTKFDELLAVVDRSKSYASMRKIIRKVNPPCIPYLGIYLTDLTFIEEGNKDMMGSLINWNKRHLISETIRVIKQYQQQAYNFKEIPEIREQLMNLPSATDDDLYLVSEYLEPRAGKERGPKPQFLTLMDSIISNLIIRKVERDEFELDISQKDYPYFQLDLPSNIEADNTNMIVSGTVPKIIERLTHHSCYDGNSTFGFLIFYRLWTTPYELMDLIITRYKVPLPSNSNVVAKWESEVKSVIEFRTFNLVRCWIDRHFYDFYEDLILTEGFYHFVELLNAADSKPRRNTFKQGRFANNIIELFNKRRQEYDKQKLFFESHSKEEHSNTIELITVDSREFAEQLTLVQHNMYFNIHPEEILNYAQGSESKCATVLKFLNYCNVFEMWIKEEIVRDENITNSVQKVLEICSELVKSKNFLAVNSIVNVLEGMIDEYPNLDTIKNSISQFRASVENGKNVSPPVILPLDGFVKDILATPALKMPDLVRGKRINMRKYLPSISDIIINFMSIQKQPFFFEPINELLDFIVTVFVHGVKFHKKKSFRISDSVNRQNILNITEGLKKKFSTMAEFAKPESDDPSSPVNTRLRAPSDSDNSLSQLDLSDLTLSTTQTGANVDASLQQQQQPSSKMSFAENVRILRRQSTQPKYTLAKEGSKIIDPPGDTSTHKRLSLQDDPTILAKGTTIKNRFSLSSIHPKSNSIQTNTESTKITNKEAFSTVNNFFNKLKSNLDPQHKHSSSSPSPNNNPLP